MPKLRSIKTSDTTPKPVPNQLCLSFKNLVYTSQNHIYHRTSTQTTNSNGEVCTPYFCFKLFLCHNRHCYPKSANTNHFTGPIWACDSSFWSFFTYWQWWLAYGSSKAEEECHFYFPRTDSSRYLFSYFNVGFLGYWYLFLNIYVLGVFLLCGFVLFDGFVELGWASFDSGDAQIGSNVTALDPSSVASEVMYGKNSGKYTNQSSGNATVYSQLYPFEGLLNYTSGIIHHVRIDGKINLVVLVCFFYFLLWLDCNHY